ncbi:YfbK domain-containing protein [Hanstruepera flava]|uniref:YfbK domain-containing protein n=1 Tax=Hanstruepera flava TaxID=2930218 RepID=UPI0020285ADF|nr:von Willebrand factor type A domain-containing protein [Hanstruepera flava]
MKKITLTLFVMLFSLQIFSQEKIISGTISDENGLPLPGVNIIVKGTTNGTQTDFEGNYEINAIVGDVLSYSFLGYKTVEKTVGAASSISFAMVADSDALEEVVVTALGIQRKPSNLAFSSHSVKMNSNTSNYSRGYSKRSNRKSKKKNNNPNIVQALSGKVSGLQVNSSNGRVNQSTRIQLRGSRGITQNNQALIVIDGKIATSEELAKLNPKKIKGVNVVKGANGAALYGSQGANGAIIVQTKSGKWKLPKELKKVINSQQTNQVVNLENNNEEYEEIEENQFENVRVSPLSTFSIDVDKASYSNIRRMINNGQPIPPNAVKIEEMINYFKYDYPQPTNDHPFSINTELVGTPWNKETQLVRIGLQGKTYLNEELPASNLTFLIDVSGSMSSANKLPLLKSAFKLLVNQLREQDHVSIVVYAGAAGVVLKPTSGNNKDKIIAALDKLQSGGSTAGGAGINLAYKLAEANFKKNGNNRVILATDGDFNVGASSDKAMQELIEEKRKSGVFLSVLGFGYGNYKDSKLETLADKGNGNHAYIDTMQEAQKVFGKEFGGTLYTIAKDVKIQIEFNPTKVEAYRLIGYENRLLADEDFVDDTKDAGELGSGHTVTALYEVIPVDTKSDYLKSIPDLKYTKTQISTDYEDELFTVKFRYKKPDGNKSIEMVHVQTDKVSKASVDMYFASAVTLYGMQLRNSEFCNSTNYSTVLELAEKGRGNDSSGYRSEFIRLVSSYNNL